MSDTHDRGPDDRAAVRDFLISRRTKITPESVGLISTGRRRVAGLRREEVAALAGVSPEWYTRLEKGHIGAVSDDVLNAVARALRLNDEERIYLQDLAKAARPQRRRQRPPTASTAPAQVQWMLDSMTLSAAMIVDQRLDVVAANSLARAIYASLFESRVEGANHNLARFHFLDPAATRFHVDWETTADDLVSSLRAEAGRNPRDTATRNLIGDLSIGSAEFRTRWAAQTVRSYRHGAKTIRHSEVGQLTLAYHSVLVPVSAIDSLWMCVYTAEPGTAADESMRLLASWSTTSPLHAR